MCKNHSHLIADYLGENTRGEAPVLIFRLRSTALTIQASTKAGPVLILPTTGLLYVPAWILGGSSALLPPTTEERATSLCLLPGDAMTTTALASADWIMSSPASLTTLGD